MISPSVIDNWYYFMLVERRLCLLCIACSSNMSLVAHIDTYFFLFWIRISVTVLENYYNVTKSCFLVLRPPQSQQKEIIIQINYAGKNNVLVEYLFSGEIISMECLTNLLLNKATFMYYGSIR